MLRCMQVRIARTTGLKSPRQALVEDILGRIHLEPPWTVDEFRLWLSNDLGMSIEIRPTREASETLLAGQCGLLAVNGTEAVIWYDESRSRRHQSQQIFHEFAHLLCGHHLQRTLVESLREGDHPLVARLHPDLRRAMFGEPSGDPARSERIEAEAELVGTKLAVKSVAASPTTQRNHSRVLTLWS